jgi:hypothetical protein
MRPKLWIGRTSCLLRRQGTLRDMEGGKRPLTRQTSFAAALDPCGGGGGGL